MSSFINKKVIKMQSRIQRDFRGLLDLLGVRIADNLSISQEGEEEHNLSLHQLILEDNFEECVKMIESGADMDSYEDGLTPVHVAIRHKRYEILSYLVEKGANLNLGSKVFVTRTPPLVSACSMDDLMSVRILLCSPRLNIEQKDYFKKTSLWAAASYASVGVVKVLLDHFADVTRDAFSGFACYERLDCVSHKLPWDSETTKENLHLMIRRGYRVPLADFCLGENFRDQDTVDLLERSGYKFEEKYFQLEIVTMDKKRQSCPINCPTPCKLCDNNPFSLLILANRFVRETLCSRWKSVHPRVVDKLPIPETLKQVVMLQ